LRFLSDASEQTLCQLEAAGEHHPNHGCHQAKADYNANQTYQQGIMVDGMPVAHGADYR
jgi:hypothetical protein